MGNICNKMTRPRSKIKMNKHRLKGPFLVQETSSTTVERSNSQAELEQDADLHLYCEIDTTIKKSKSQAELAQDADLHLYCEVDLPIYDLPVSSPQIINGLPEISVSACDDQEGSRQRCIGTVEPLGLSPSIPVAEELIESTSPYGRLFACKQNTPFPVQARNSASQLQYSQLYGTASSSEQPHIEVLAKTLYEEASIEVTE